ncbi:Dihydroorotate dehydrogenase (quinone), mitochondrial, partial [Massospora cicadina]
FYEKARDSAILVTGVACLSLGLVYYFDSRSAIHTYLINPLMRYFLDPETAHRISILAANYGLAPKEVNNIDPECLKTEVWGRMLSNPVGLAAGYDKHAEAIDPMFDLGFGLVEVGSVTPKPQEGNPLPRYFRLPEDKAVINRYGFNSVGHEAVETRLKNRLWKHIKQMNWKAGVKASESEYHWPKTKSCKNGKLLGINLGKNKSSAIDSPQDYIDGVLSLGHYADYLVVNISSPNTPGLRELQKVSYFKNLISEVQNARDQLPSPRPPLLVKVAPDISDSELEGIARTIPKIVAEAGGLSGQPLKPLALAVVSKLYKLTDGRVPIIGCGGISSGDDAIQFARAGASLVQFYTHLGYRGPVAPHEIKNQIASYLTTHNMSWKQLIGADHK